MQAKNFCYYSAGIKLHVFKCVQDCARVCMIVHGFRNGLSLLRTVSNKQNTYELAGCEAAGKLR